MTGPSGPAACTASGEGLGLRAELGVSAPQKGKAFAVGEAPVLTIRVLDRCARPVALSDLGTASLYLSGPRAPLLTRTASKLLNAVTDRAATDRQHHFINLIAPRFADPKQSNLTRDADGTLRYRLAPISDEKPGTYTAGLWVKSKDEREQLFPLQALQIGTEQVESYSSGPPDASTCADCHRGPDSGKLYMAHILPGFSPLGNFALDAAPVGTCQGCHNIDGYSLNPTVRKVHGAHRGEHLTNPGVAHPEYGLGADATLAEYVNIGFPAMPDGEKDCVKCHRDERWRTAPSRLGCGTCHDAVFFDRGTLEPPRRQTKTCKLDADCATPGGLATCNLAAGLCEIAVHPRQTDDSQCATCHSADSSGITPIAASHEIYTRTRVRKLKISDATISGGSGASGAVQVGDRLTLNFKVVDGQGAPVADLKTNAALAGTLLIGGPTDARQLVFPSINVKTSGTLSYDALSGSYSYTLASTFPAQAPSPLNNPAQAPRPNPAGTYTAWLYVVETSTVNGAQVRDVGNFLVDFRFADATLPLRPRQVITQAACDSCHVTVQAHGGSRSAATGCSLCHASGAQDRTVGAVGAACVSSSDCRAFEACQDTNNDGKADACVITQDPTPGRTIQFGAMVHSIHYARRLEGYAARSSLVNPGKLVYIGFRNSITDLSEILTPVDIRQCAKCHADSGAVCSAASPCGVGQSCVGGRCVNRSYQTPSTEICLSCHDSAAAAGHAALNTWQTIETCSVCHGPTGDFAVSKVHNISAPYVPPYPREKD